MFGIVFIAFQQSIKSRGWRRTEPKQAQTAASQQANHERSGCVQKNRVELPFREIHVVVKCQCASLLDPVIMVVYHSCAKKDWAHQSEITFAQLLFLYCIRFFREASRILSPARCFHHSQRFDPITCDKTLISS